MNRYRQTWTERERDKNRQDRQKWIQIKREIEKGTKTAKQAEERTNREREREKHREGEEEGEIIINYFFII